MFGFGTIIVIPLEIAFPQLSFKVIIMSWEPCYPVNGLISIVLVPAVLYIFNVGVIVSVNEKVTESPA